MDAHTPALATFFISILATQLMSSNVSTLPEVSLCLSGLNTASVGQAGTAAELRSPWEALNKSGHDITPVL